MAGRVQAPFGLRSRGAGAGGTTVRPHAVASALAIALVLGPVDSRAQESAVAQAVELPEIVVTSPTPVKKPAQKPKAKPAPSGGGGGSQQAQQNQQGQTSSQTNQQAQGEQQSGQQSGGQPNQTSGEQAQQEGGQPAQGQQAGEQAGQMPGAPMSGAGDQQSSASEQGASGSTSAQNNANNNPDGEGEGAFDQIFAPQRLGGQQGEAQIELEPDPDDMPVVEGEFSQNPQGNTTFPYNEVFSDYADAANRALESDYVPLGLRDVVRDYFSGLEPSNR